MESKNLMVPPHCIDVACWIVNGTLDCEIGVGDQWHQSLQHMDAGVILRLYQQL